MSMPEILLGHDEADLVRDALGQKCERCQGCRSCFGSGINPSPVHLVVEGDRKYCSFHFSTVYERYTQEYGIADPGTESCVCSWLPPSRWPVGERVVLTDECVACQGDGFKPVDERLPGNHNFEQWKCSVCGSEGVVPLASATVKLFTVDGKIDDEADEHWLHVDGYDPMLLPRAPRPGIDWVVRLSEITP